LRWDHGIAHVQDRHDPLETRQKLGEQLHSLGEGFGYSTTQAGDIRARPREAGDDVRADGITACGHDHRDAPRRPLGGQGRWGPPSHDHVDFQAYEIVDQGGESIVSAV
jgi:hypothetical protein